MPFTVLLFLCCLQLPDAAVQPATTPFPSIVPISLPTLGSGQDERLRLDGLLPDERAAERRTKDAHRALTLLRSPSTLAELSLPPLEAPYRLTLVEPELRSVSNSDLPNSLNEGSLWAGRGASLLVRGGVRLDAGPIDPDPTGRGRARVTLILAPEYTWSENRDFQTASFPESGGSRERHPLASPFHYPPGSMDLPQRPGEDPVHRWGPGQSSLTVRAGGAAFGLATENLWWGPGIRNALLMSSNAPGVPHLFLRTARPVELRIRGAHIGELEGRWILGRLERSDYFLGPGADPDDVHRYRSLSAAAVTLRPAFDENLTLGIARAVYAPADGTLPLGAALDVLRSVGRPGEEPGDTLLSPGPDQILSLFWRWAFPGAGFEAYGEWGRFEQPANLRDLMELPHHTRGYTVGLQWARAFAPRGRPGRLRLQGEVTNLEPSYTYRVRGFGDWYASRRVPEGYTHQGRVLGAAIGPGGSSQWLAVDWFGPDWRVGGFMGRIRWEGQAQQTFRPELRRADVSMFSGVRAGARVGPVHLEAEYTSTARLNYLFQARFPSPLQEEGVDIANHTLKLTLSARGSLR